jgi:hypothetical protein
MLKVVGEGTPATTQLGIGGQHRRTELGERPKGKRAECGVLDWVWRRAAAEETKGRFVFCPFFSSSSLHLINTTKLRPPDPLASDHLSSLIVSLPSCLVPNHLVLHKHRTVEQYPYARRFLQSYPPPSGCQSFHKDSLTGHLSTALHEQHGCPEPSRPETSGFTDHGSVSVWRREDDPSANVPGFYSTRRRQGGLGSGSTRSRR